MKYQQPSFTLPVSNGRMSQKQWEMRMGIRDVKRKGKPIHNAGDLPKSKILFAGLDLATRSELVQR